MIGSIRLTTRSTLIHPAIRRRGDVVTTCLWTSQRSRKNVPNETLNNVSLERRLDVSMVRLHNVLLERRDYVLKGRHNDVPLVRLHDVSVVHIHDVPLLPPYDVSWKSQMKHLITLMWYVSTTSRSYVSVTISTFSSYFVMSSIW